MAYAFVSHRSTDKQRLRPFVLRLIDRQVPTWIDNPEQFNVNLPAGEPRIETSMLAGRIRPATDWPVEIDKALLGASAIVLFWSGAWQADRAVLAREHGVALALHRAGTALYLPVFLDDPSTLPSQLLDYRINAGDNVQAFNVASYGQEHWTALVDAVECACLAGTAGAAPDSEWLTVISSARPDSATAAALKRFPEGPAVDVFAITTALQRAFANGTNEVTAPGLVNAASRLVVTALGFSPPNLQAYVIMPADLPVPDRGLATYWAHAFTHACLLGPRMVAALLLAAPPPLLIGVRIDAAHLLENLERL